MLVEKDCLNLLDLSPMLAATAQIYPSIAKDSSLFEVTICSWAALSSRALTAKDGSVRLSVCLSFWTSVCLYV